ncbi:MAG: alpha/beta hydrolase [Thermomicrobiales bacterium]
MRQERGTFSPTPGVIVATAAWIPDAPRAILVFSHGHAEHAGRYALLVTTMVSEGFVVATLDHRGHGRSSGTRALAMRFDDYVDDLGTVVTRTKAAFPGLPLVLFGHSMGGLIAVRYAEARPETVDFLITSGPALIIDEGTSPIARKAGEVIARVAPAAPVPRSEGNVLSTDETIGIGFDADHRTHHGETRMRTAVEMVHAGEDARTWFDRLTMPLLAMHGADDELTSPRGTELLYKGASTSDRTIVLWPGMRHELLNEPDRGAVMQFIVDWIVPRLGTSSAQGSLPV